MFAVLNFLLGVYFTNQTVYRPETMRYLPIARKTAIAIANEMNSNETYPIIVMQCPLQLSGQLLNSPENFADIFSYNFLLMMYYTVKLCTNRTGGYNTHILKFSYDMGKSNRLYAAF